MDLRPNGVCKKEHRHCHGLNLALLIGSRQQLVDNSIHAYKLPPHFLCLFRWNASCQRHYTPMSTQKVLKLNAFLFCSFNYIHRFFLLFLFPFAATFMAWGLAVNNNIWPSCTPFGNTWWIIIAPSRSLHMHKTSRWGIPRATLVCHLAFTNQFGNYLSYPRSR